MKASREVGHRWGAGTPMRVALFRSRLYFGLCIPPSMFSSIFLS